MHERRAVRAAELLVEHAVRAGDRAVRPEVAEHREREALLRRPLLLRVARVARDREHLRLHRVELRQVVAQRAQLALADAGERERVEDDHDVLRAAERRQRHVVAVLVLQREVGGLLADLDGHGGSSRSSACRSAESTCSVEVRTAGRDRRHAGGRRRGRRARTTSPVVSVSSAHVQPFGHCALVGMSTPGRRVVVEQHRHDVAVRAQERAGRRVLAHERERLVERARPRRARRPVRPGSPRAPAIGTTVSMQRTYGLESTRSKVASRSRSIEQPRLAMTAARQRAQPVVVVPRVAVSGLGVADQR